MDDSNDDAVAELRDFVARRVREGFESAHDIAAGAGQFAAESLPPGEWGLLARRLVAEQLDAHRAEEGAWDGPTDNDRLDSAFAALEAVGVVARQNFSCCNACGFQEIWDEVDAAELEHPAVPVVGYVFYHLQATERAIEDGELLLTYGCLGETELELDIVVGRIRAELRRAGLVSEWGGTAGHPIRVAPFAWRRRAPAT